MVSAHLRSTVKLAGTMRRDVPTSNRAATVRAAAGMTAAPAVLRGHRHRIYEQCHENCYVGFHVASQRLSILNDSNGNREARYCIRHGAKREKKSGYACPVVRGYAQSLTGAGFTHHQGTDLFVDFDRG